MIHHPPGRTPGKARGETEYLHAAGVVDLLYLLSVAPLFCVSLIDLAAEWRAAFRGESTDPAQHVAMAGVALVGGALAGVCFLLAAAASLYVLWRGSRAQRLRVAGWYGAQAVILLIEILGPQVADFSVRFQFSLYETLLMLPLLILPVVWLWRDRQHYLPNLASN